MPDVQSTCSQCYEKFKLKRVENHLMVYKSYRKVLIAFGLVLYGYHTRKEILNNSRYVCASLHRVQRSAFPLYTRLPTSIKANKACNGREYKKKPEQLH